VVSVLLDVVDDELLSVLLVELPVPDVLGVLLGVLELLIPDDPVPEVPALELVPVELPVPEAPVPDADDPVPVDPVPVVDEPVAPGVRVVAPPVPEVPEGLVGLVALEPVALEPVPDPELPVWA
jgi:hypothetical protein